MEVMGINQLASYALLFVVVGLILGFGSLILEETQDQIDTVTGTTVSAGHNVTGDALTGMLTFGDWMPILAIVIVAGIVITLLLGSFMLRGAGRA